ncbi:hypothetical protein FJ970_25285 [Mesorhizobium sp. B2-1-8]|uniref:hypothetical protein n=1 Tax=Mesorhizobium sp. B2-1-8 TaxID=2589967 RepID=UPI0015E43150|nr:hypothetical protein [Mesorhizobium sp. B2-1-8]UCI18362.1 hypothetical protein FJ970_25285 [Mesorhizobium sp. B2-1-8]
MLDVKGAKIGQLQRHKSKEAGTAAPFAIPLIGHRLRCKTSVHHCLSRLRFDRNIAAP